MHPQDERWVIGEPDTAKPHRGPPATFQMAHRGGIEARLRVDKRRIAATFVCSRRRARRRSAKT